MSKGRKREATCGPPTASRFRLFAFSRSAFSIAKTDNGRLLVLTGASRGGELTETAGLAIRQKMGAEISEERNMRAEGIAN